MSNIGNSNRNLPQDPHQGSDGALLGFVGLGVMAVAAWSVLGVFASSVIAGAATLFALLLFGFVIVQVVRAGQVPRLSLGLLAAGAIWTACSGLVVFEYHWLAFTPAAWVMNVLFVAALVTGAWARLEAWAKLLAGLAAAALVVATYVLPRPPGGEGAWDTAEKWKVDVSVVDASDNAPLAGARVLCATVMQWEDTLEFADSAARTTDAQGNVDTWEFEDDNRLKVVLCSAWKNEDDANAGYPVEVQLVAAPVGGGHYAVRLALKEAPHPEVAFLALDLSGAFASQNWFYLDFELWAGEPDGGWGAGSGQQPLLKKSYRDLRGGFRIPAAQASSAMTLRYRYEGPAPGDALVPPYAEVHTVPVDAVPAGGRQRLALEIPARQAPE